MRNAFARVASRAVAVSMLFAGSAQSQASVHSRRMADPQTPPPLAKSQPSFRRQNSTILKLLGVGALILVMLIPLLMIDGVLRERLQRRNEAVDEITSAWGKEQNIIGPVLCLPYRYRVMVVREVPAELHGDQVDRQQD